MLNSLEKLAADPILGLTVAYNKDDNPNKVDLGAGVYKDADGKTPVFVAVKKAEAIWHEEKPAVVVAHSFDRRDADRLSRCQIH